MHGHACKQYIFRSYNIYFQCYAFWWKSVHMPVRKRRLKSWTISNFSLVLVVFKWHHGSEGVNGQAWAHLKFITGLYSHRSLERSSSATEQYYSASMARSILGKTVAALQHSEAEHSGAGAPGYMRLFIFYKSTHHPVIYGRTQAHVN